MLSQMTQAPIVPLAFAARRAARLGSWDRMFLAVPFTTIALVAGEPFTAPRKLDESALEAYERRVAEELHRLEREARAQVAG